MTTLNSLGSAEPEPSEVAHASLAMADYDAKGGNYAAALDWLAVAAQFRVLTQEYRHQESRLGGCAGAARLRLVVGAGVRWRVQATGGAPLGRRESPAARGVEDAAGRGR
jgi:hypothetical protein